MSRRLSESYPGRAIQPRPMIRGTLDDDGGRAAQVAAWEAMDEVQRRTGRTAAEWEQWHKDQRKKTA